MGLANRPDQPFPHDFTESDELLQAMRRHRVAARHGDLFDPFNFEGDRCASSLGDAVVIELVSRFAAEVETQLADELPATTVLGLREIDNIRPVLLVPVWIDGLLERTCAFPADAPAGEAGVGPAGGRVPGDRLRATARHLEPRWTWWTGCERALKFSKRLSIGWASSLGELAEQAPRRRTSPTTITRWPSRTSATGGRSTSSTATPTWRRPCPWTPVTPRGTC